MSSHTLDWSIQPQPFKIYQNLSPIPLPREKVTTKSLPSPILHDDETKLSSGAPTLDHLCRLLYFSAGVTRRRRHPGGEFFFRAASCTGALYEIDLYVVCADLNGLAAGVYHFNPRDFSLYPLRQGDHRGVLTWATGQDKSLIHAPVVLLSTGTYWRNSWKYQARTYRHLGWDNGTILANLLRMCHSIRLPAKLILGFVDEKINQLLNLDTQREVGLSLVAIGTQAPAPPPPPPVEALDLETKPLSMVEVAYPEILQMHSSTQLHSAQEVVAWKDSTRTVSSTLASGRLFDLDIETGTPMDRQSLERVILRRGSSRQFLRNTITFSQFSNLLHRASQGVQADFLNPLGHSLSDWYLLVHAVDGIPSGSYFFHRAQRQIELLQEGDHRETARHLGLGQSLPSDASFNVFFLAKLKEILQYYGNRGYRAAQLEAGILGGNLYLEAYYEHLGATGLTFFDDDVIKFFSPHAEGKDVLFLMALGHGRKQKVQKRFL